MDKETGKGKKKRKNSIDYKDRYNTIGMVFLVVFLVICGEFARVHFVYGDLLLSRWNRINREITSDKRPKRGSLYAADDRPLAISLPLYNLYVNPRDPKFDPIYELDKLPKRIQKQPEDVQRVYQDSLRKKLDSDLVALVDTCASWFGKDHKSKFKRDLALKKIREAYKKRTRAVRFLDKINEAERQELFSVPPLAELTSGGTLRGKSLLGRTISLDVWSERKHPFGQLALRTIGSIDSVFHGKNGLERAFDKELAGEAGRVSIHHYGKMGSYSEVIKPVIDGSDVYTNLDMGIQDRLFGYLYEQLDSLDAVRGTAAIMEVKTGKIIAQVNLSKMPDGTYSDNESLLYTDLSEPGSTFKVASILALLDDGYVTDSTKVDVGNGVWAIKESRRPMRDHNAHRGGYGVINMSQVIEYSSNIGIAKMVHKYYDKDPNVFLDKVRSFGYGVDLKLDMEGVAKARIKKAGKDASDWWGTSLRWISHGYETSIPPIYTLAFFNAIANEGRLMRPYLVRKIQGNNSAEVQERGPEVLREQIASPQAVRTVQGMLRRVVTKGTGAPLRSNIVSISGKTGTAVLSPPGRRSYQLSFCGFFPSENPEYTGIVVIRDPKKMAIASAGGATGPVFRKIAEYIVSQRMPLALDSLKPAKDEHLTTSMIYGRKERLASLLKAQGLSYRPDTTLRSGELVRVDRSGVETSVPPTRRHVVPSVVGMNATEANYLLLKAGLSPSFVGRGRVVGQSIASGKKVETGTPITLTLQRR